MIVRLAVFLVFNFAALAIGGLFTSTGVLSDWYVNLAKAPWTPPGRAFGIAWTTIMICFSVYMAYLWSANHNNNILISLYIIQWVLNVGWNPTFFYFHSVWGGLILISGLTVLIGFFFVTYWPDLKIKSVFILPYFIWLIIATSLNGYIVFKN